MRRLPVYLLLDTSGSMMGEPIESVKNGVQVMVSSLRQNPQAIETAYLSVITFDSSARQIIPLKSKVAFTVACAAGSGADTDILKQITDSVVSLDNADSQSISKFFAWVTASIGVSSTKVEDSGKEVTGLNELPPPPSELNIVV